MKIRRFLIYVMLFGILIVGGVALYHRDQIRSPGDFFRLAGDYIDRIRGVPANSRHALWKTSRQNLIRIGSFNTRGLDQHFLATPRTEAVLAGIIRQFDVVALQEVSMEDPWMLTRFLRKLGEAPDQYDFVAGVPDKSVDPPVAQVFIYNRRTLELDGKHYTVHDPDNLIQRKPLVGWFRTRSDPAESAFTFSLVSVQFHPQSASNELLQIGPLFRAVRGDARGEDDVVIVGDFGAPATLLASPEIGNGLFPLIRDVASSTAGHSQPANILLDSIATSEFSGDSGVFDFMKAANMTLAEAEMISDQLPVWADFHVLENNQPGRVARR